MKSFRTLTIGLTLIACALGVNGGQAVIETVGLEEFAGGTNIPFPRLSMNAIDQFTALVNDAVGGEVLDAHYYKSMTQRPRGLILVPGDNQKDGPYDLLVLIDETGGLLYMDSKQSHSNTFQGHSFAKVGRYTIESRKNARSSNVVSNFRGDFWIVDHGTEAILRVRHEWTGERNVFTVVGRYKPGEGRLVDIYYTDMKTEDPADDRLYYISQLPSKIVVIAPFFEGDVSGATLAKRQSKTNPYDSLQNPKVIAGAYNNEPAARDQDEETIYVIDKRNRFNIYRDNGREILQIGVSKAVYNRATRYASMRTNAEGEIYIVDEGNGRLLKYTKDFERLYCVGRTGRDSNPWDIQFMAPFGIATRGKDIFVSEVFHHNSGVQRFHNVAKILEHRIESLAYNGYNPEKCTQGKRPFPSIKFKVSEACQVRLTIYRREYDNLDSNLALTPLWADTLDTLSSGWHDHPIQWNGLDPQGNVVTGDVVFAITTHRYWSDGDDAELELFRIDRTPPHIVDLGDLQYPLYVSSVKPFHVDVPLNETAHGRMYVHNAADVVVDSVLHTPSVEDIERRYPRVRFDWPVAKLDSCEVFDVSFVFEDLAGNETETPVSLTGVTGTTLRNASGGYHRAFVPYQSQRDLTGFRKNHRAQCAYRDGCLEQLL